MLTFEDFKKDLDKNNCTCLCYTDEPENNAIIKRLEGITSVFNDTQLAGSKEELCELINDPEATYTLIALNDSCKECVIEIANDKLNDGMNILNIGVNDVTSVNRNEIKENAVPKVDAIGGSCPECQANVLHSSINGDKIKSKGMWNINQEALGEYLLSGNVDDPWFSNFPAKETRSHRSKSEYSKMLASKHTTLHGGRAVDTDSKPSQKVLKKMF